MEQHEGQHGDVERTGPEAERLIAGVQRRGVKRFETGAEAERLIARMQRKLH